MKLSVIGSSSKGNSYILQNDNEALILECGIRVSEIKKVLSFDISKVCCCLISHEHKDHCTSAFDLAKLGIDIYASKGTLEAIKAEGHRFNILKNKKQINVGDFKILPFKTMHDAAEPMGFLINHFETGNILFITDTHYISFKFKDLDHIIIEANYSQELIDNLYIDGKIDPMLRRRVVNSHMSIETCLQLLRGNDMSKVKNVILAHLSDGHSNEKGFIEIIERQIGKKAYVADYGSEIEILKEAI